MSVHGLIVGVMAAVAANGPAGVDDTPPAAAAVARDVLDDARPQAEREALVKSHPELSDALIAAMAADLTPGTKEEARRIPWVWRVAVAAGKRNDAGELRRILAVALPKPDGRLDDWRAVVVGGGLINGVSQAGAWPGARFEALLKDDPGLKARWARAVKLASAMADDPSVSTGTRYDALRLLGTADWDEHGAQLFRYLTRGTHPELQMGAVSGLSDVAGPPACVAQALASGLGHYPAENLDLALDALLRDEPRASALLDAVAEGRVKPERLGKARADALLGHASEAVRGRARKLLAR